ncbi:MAG: IclR family transcriptional regulator [Deltaproteobacteria bacterium]|nr:IclR family transcriptional regulator [Deltaproteobacteria bacterium]
MVRSLERGIDILFLFSNERPALSVQDIAHSIGVPRGTAYRFVMTLKKKGLLERDSRSGYYRLGLKLLELQGIIHRKMDLEALSMPFLEELAKTSGETVQLTVISSGRGICIYVEESHSTLRVAPERGRVLPLHAGASVQAILAFLPQEERSRICSGPLEHFTPYTITDPEKLAKRLEIIREHGYAVTSEEVFIGGLGIAAPIFNRDHRVIASVSISGPIPRMTEKKNVLAQEVLRVADSISRVLALCAK